MRNLINEKVEAYINSHISPSKELQLELEKYSKEHGIPIVTKDTISIIKALILLNKPKEILEFGTAIGYSAIEMVRASEYRTRVTTVERNEKRYNKAVEYVKEANCQNNIRLFYGDAIEMDIFLDREYDMVFIDAAKGQYKKFYDKAIGNLVKGGVVLSDNIFQNALICEKNVEDVKRRQRTIYRRMNEYLDFLTKTKGLFTTLVPIGDGLAITIVDGE